MDCNIKEYKGFIRYKSKIEDIIVEIYPSFDDWWDLYAKKSSNKKGCLRKWKKFSQKTKEAIILHSEQYIKSTSDVQYRKNAETYLNQEHWNNEILIVNAKDNESRENRQQGLRNEFEEFVNNPENGYTG